MTSFNRWLNQPNHRLFLFVCALFVCSWFVVVPQLRLAFVLLEIEGVPQLINLSSIKELTFATRLVANALDYGLNFKVLLNSVSGADIGFWTLLILFAWSRKGMLTWIHQTVLVLQVFLNGLFFVRFWQLTFATNPNAALAWLRQLGYLHLIFSSISLLLLFIGFVYTLLKLDANTLHEGEEV